MATMFRSICVAAVVVATLCSARTSADEPRQYYHVSRAVFRAPAMNRGMAVDAGHFWVGEFGGWIRCFDRNGKRLPQHDLGDGTQKYLGHGTAAADGLVATGAWDTIAVFLLRGGPVRRLTPPVPGNPCAVASDGKTIWAMNYQSPVLYHLDLNGKLLGKFNTAQRSSPTSCDIALDCDGHLYVLDGTANGSQGLLEYLPDGKLMRTHRLSAAATAVAIDVSDRAKTLYTVNFAGDPIVYEYRLQPGQPKDRPLPAMARQQRYRPEGQEIVIDGGTNRFNRPLYGSNSAFFVYAGDLPEFMMSLPGKGGTLWLGLVAGEKSKWLAQADRVVARYRAGAMRYEVSDKLLGSGSLTIDVVPRPEGEGMVLRLVASADVAPIDLACAFGGASGVTAWTNYDTCGYTPESLCWLRPEDCEKNEFALTPTGFTLRGAAHKNRPMAGVLPPGIAGKVADADQLVSPKSLLASTGGRRPIYAGRCPLRPGTTHWLALDWLAPGATAPKPPDIPRGYEAAQSRREKVAAQVRVSTPDPYMNAAVPAICSAADGIWDPPVYVHGGVAWHMPYLGWRGAYAGSVFGWPERAKAHFRAFAAVQLKEPATGKPKADPQQNLARQADDSVIYTRGYIPVHPEKTARGPYDMQQVYIDQLLWHFLWSGDLEFVREMWPVLVAHLEWEKRCFDPDDDGLYENFANTFISDAHHYSGGPCTQASAYNYRALRMAARLAQILGKDPAPFGGEAEKTLSAMNRVLWMPQRGWFAEYRDLLGLKRLHESAELPSVYHPIDSLVPDRFQAWQMLRYVDTAIEHIPITDNATMLWSSNWVPFIWSVRDVCGVEVAHTALAYWQAGRPEKAYELWRGAIVDSMYCCRAPGACIGTSELDGHMTGLCTDFADTVGMYARTLVEGLFGIVPDALAGELVIRPGFPKAWPTATIDTPDVGYTFVRRGDVDEYTVRSRFRQPMRLRLRVVARAAEVAEATVNGKPAAWKCIEGVGQPTIEIAAAEANSAIITIRWAGGPLAKAKISAVVAAGETLLIDVAPALCRQVQNPQGALHYITRPASSTHAEAPSIQITESSINVEPSPAPGHRTAFVRVEQGKLAWWMPIEFEVRAPLEIARADVDRDAGAVALAIRNNTDRAIAAAGNIACGAARRSVALHVAPRSTSAAVRLSAQGLVPGTNSVVVELERGVSVRGRVVDWQKADASLAKSMDCVDLAKHFNDRVSQIFQHQYLSPRSPYCSLQMPVNGQGDWCYCGKTVPKIDDAALRAAAGKAGRFTAPQGVVFATPGPGTANNVLFTSRWDNFPAEATIPLAGRAQHVWFLVAGSTHPMHSQMDNGEILVTYADGGVERLPLHNPTTWWPIEGDYQVSVDGFCVPGPHPPRIDLGAGRATLLDLPLDSKRLLKSLTVRCLTNEVVVGLMSATLLRE